MMKLYKILAASMLTLATVPIFGQDLLARQAPIDRKMKAVDSVALQRLIRNEEAQEMNSSVYEDWNNEYAHRVASEVPDSFRIDLRHFCMPTPSRVLTSHFGARWGRQHKGLDIKVYIGDTIRAAFSGKVRIVNYEARGYGNYIVIRHNNGLETIYGHLSKQLVSENENVKAGDPIGLGGNTGRSTGSHLHFETRFLGIAINPALMFDFPEQDVTNDYFVFRKSTYLKENEAASRNTVIASSYSRSSVSPSNSRNDRDEADNRNMVNDGTTRFHKVAAGDTLYSIARKLGTTVDNICKLNHIGKDFRLRPGQVLKYS
jgi:murein DD-endopeptidase MepM/ murein hydrolase activator NlpD